MTYSKTLQDPCKPRSILRDTRSTLVIKRRLAPLTGRLIRDLIRGRVRRVPLIRDTTAPLIVKRPLQAIAGRLISSIFS